MKYFILMTLFFIISDLQAQVTTSIPPLVVNLVPYAPKSLEEKEKSFVADFQAASLKCSKVISITHKDSLLHIAVFLRMKMGHHLGAHQHGLACESYDAYTQCLLNEDPVWKKLEIIIKDKGLPQYLKHTYDIDDVAVSGLIESYKKILDARK